MAEFGIAMKGKLIQLNISPGGIPKKPIQEAFVSFERVEGDAWRGHTHGGKDAAVCLFSTELIEELNAEGYTLFPGAVGENFTTAGLDYRRIKIGDVFQVGAEVQIKIAKNRIPCNSLDVYGKGMPERIYDAEVKNGNVETAKWGMSGFKCSVLKEGFVRPGDEIVKIG
jgi:MOSC domain-containing protein YiiM